MDSYESCLRLVNATEQKAFRDQVLFLTNMSCMGQEHPALEDHASKIEREFGVKVEAQGIEAAAITYGDLSDGLRFCGAEVLLIDAEGHDCQILKSMLDHCGRQGNEHHWPDIIQFESMGHCDKIDGEGAESNVVRALRRDDKYALVARGKDTQMVRVAALHSEQRIQQWVETLQCDHCRVRGENGFPFRIKSGTKPTSCSTCGDVLRCLGTCAFEWQTMEGNGPRLTSIATDGNVLWGLCANGTPSRHIKGTWERVGDYSASWERLEQIAVVGKDLWAVDSNGFLRRQSNKATTPKITSWTRITAPHSNSRLKHMTVTKVVSLCGVQMKHGVFMCICPKRPYGLASLEDLAKCPFRPTACMYGALIQSRMPCSTAMA